VVTALILGRAQHSETGMPSVGIILAFDPFEDGVTKLLPGFPFREIEQFQLHAVPE
jgi:hypothetical protein